MTTTSNCSNKHYWQRQDGNK